MNCLTPPELGAGGRFGRDSNLIHKRINRSTVIKTKKQFGQHWLRSEKALAKIVTSAQLQPTDRVLEIGPGTGILTRPLIDGSAAVVAVEVDRTLCELLAKKLGKVEKFLLLQGDFLSMDLDDMLKDLPNFANPKKVVANIPYNITGPILEKLLGTISNPNPNPFESIVLLVQKEVALRLCANANNSNYGALSIRVQYLADCEFLFDVPAKSFQPPPKVDSAVIRIKPRPTPTPAQDPQYFERLLRMGFSSRRKMLRNNLKSTISSEELSQLLEDLGQTGQARAEQLNIAQWTALSDRVKAYVKDHPQENLPPEPEDLAVDLD